MEFKPWLKVLSWSESDPRELVCVSLRPNSSAYCQGKVITAEVVPTLALITVSPTANASLGLIFGYLPGTCYFSSLEAE